MVALSLNYSRELRDQILKTAMPKFIWCGELSTLAFKKANKNNGIILLDATETTNRNCLLLASYNDIIVYEDPNSLIYQLKRIPLQSFESYNKNLNYF